MPKPFERAYHLSVRLNTKPTSLLELVADLFRILAQKIDGRASLSLLIESDPVVPEDEIVKALHYATRDMVTTLEEYQKTVIAEEAQAALFPKFNG